MKDFEKTLKALANRRRLAILKYLRDNGEAPVGEIAGFVKLSFRSTSRHLRVLSSARIVDYDKRGLMVYYMLVEDQHPAAKTLIKLI